MKNGTYRLASKQNRQRLAQGLGWFSIGLGLAEVLAPRALARLIGVNPRPGLLRLLGLREIASGIGILSQAQPGAWLKSRVAGDAMDLGLLGASFLSENSQGGRLAMATAAVAGVTALDVLASQDFSPGADFHATEPAQHRDTVFVRRSLIINRPPDQIYQAWHDFERLPRFMNHLFSVQARGENRWHWVAKGPAGSRVEWDAELTQDQPNEFIAWRSLQDADVDNRGSVRFQPAPGGRGTIVRVELEYRPPAGKVGAKMAKLFGEAPEKQIAVDLLRFKQMVETGEIARTEGQPAGRSRSTSQRFDQMVRT